MRWYKHLFVGKRAKKLRFRIIQNIRSNKPLPGTYVITPSLNGNNIFEIYPAVVLMQDYYQKQNMLITGIALGYFEALEVARDIVDDMYTKTGELDFNTYLERIG